MMLRGIPHFRRSLLLALALGLFAQACTPVGVARGAVKVGTAPVRAVF